MTINCSLILLEFDESTQDWSIEQPSQFRRNRRGRGDGVKMQGGDCWSRSGRLKLA